MTTGIRRFILRFIVGLLAFLLGVAAAMAFAGFRPFDTNQNGQQNYRQYRYKKKSCNYQFRSFNVLPPPPPAPPAPSVQHGVVSTVHLKGPEGITVSVGK